MNKPIEENVFLGEVIKENCSKINGIRCPMCGAMMVDVSSNVILDSKPDLRPVKIKCPDCSRESFRELV